MIILVRHGETDGNAQRILQTPDTPLSQRGHAQALRVAERLAQHDIRHILSSDLLRARQTAEAIAARTGAQLETSPLLQERSFGDLRGTPYAELKVDPFDPDFAPPQGETWQQFHARVARGFAWIIERSASLSGDVVVVSHGLYCARIVTHHAAPPAGLRIPVRFDNTSVTLLAREAPHAATLINCTAHLPASTTCAGAPA